MVQPMIAASAVLEKVAAPPLSALRLSRMVQFLSVILPVVRSAPPLAADSLPSKVVSLMAETLAMLP